MRTSIIALLLLLKLGGAAPVDENVLAEVDEDADGWLLRLAQCEARACSQDNECNTTFVDSECCESDTDCHPQCQCARLEEIRNDSATPPFMKPQMHCHDRDIISVRWRDVDEENQDDGDVVYALEYRTPEDTAWLPLTITRRTILSLQNLTPSSLYKVRVRAVGAAGQLGSPVESDWLDTRPNEGQHPDPPSSVRLDSISYGANGGKANISWTPSDRDPACMYRIHWFSGKDWHSGEKELEMYEAPFNTTLSNLLYGDNYTVFLFSLTSDTFMTSNARADLENGIQTKSCLDAHQYNLTICPPDAVQNVTVSQRLPAHALDDFKTNGSLRMSVEVTVKWARPRRDPDLYRLLVSDGRFYYPDEEPLANITVPGNATQVVINISASDVFVVKIWGSAEGGEGPRSIHMVSLSHFPRAVNPGWAVDQVVMWAAVFVVGMGLLLATMWYLRLWHGKKFAHERSLKGFEGTERGVKVQDMILARFSPFTAPEVPEGSLIPREMLIVGEELGTGCFGIVYKGELNSSDCSTKEVAVKMLKENATSDDELQFSKEIDVMKSVGRHPHIVSMIGCCVEGWQRLLVVEYCELGNLLDFLHKAWRENEHAGAENIKYAELSHDVSGSLETEDNRPQMTAVFNASYGLDFSATDMKSRLNLTAADLLSIGRQVAIGMEYLANLRVVHRDLAARNILVCGDRTVKISDFGLSRDVYEQNVYHQNTVTKMPIKWMAIEALQRREYTTQSDVWSFGILLWEIVTFGASPYPSISNNDLLEHLVEGHRNKKPSSCGPELYEVMLHCWKKEPSARPTFSQLKVKLDEMLQDAGAHYMQLG